jgi:hypothetical protein
MVSSRQRAIGPIPLRGKGFMKIDLTVKLQALAAAVAIACLTISSPASAAVVEIVFTGTVADESHDYGGVFGLAGTTLWGYAFTADYRFDTAIGSVGGVSQGNASPSLGATITINGHSVFIDGGYFGMVSNFTEQAQQVSNFVGGAINSDLYNYTTGLASSTPVSLTESGSYSFMGLQGIEWAILRGHSGRSACG